MNGLINLMGVPKNPASEQAYLVDLNIEVVHWIMFALFIGWTTYFFIALIKFRRKKSPNANYTGVTSHTTTHLEIGVVIAEMILLFGFAFPAWKKRTTDFPPDAQKVRIIGYQYGWLYHYPGIDKIFGRTDTNLVESNNTVGLDYSDINSADDIIVSTALVLPNKRPSIAYITSMDVIHNYAITNMRIAQDATPGELVPTLITPIRTGNYEVICGQLCGFGHSGMIGNVEVKTGDEYEEWFRKNSTDSKLKTFSNLQAISMTKFSKKLKLQSITDAF